MLVVVCGLPSIGKTTVAERVGVELLRIDVVRRELFPEPAYTGEERHAVYRALFDRARTRLERGADVVLDGTFAAATHRERAGELAATVGVEHRVVAVICEERVVRERIADGTDDENDADFGVYRTFEAAFEPVDADNATAENSGGGPLGGGCDAVPNAVKGPAGGRGHGRPGEVGERWWEAARGWGEWGIAGRQHRPIRG